MKKPVKIAVAGAGLIGKRHIEHVLASPEAELAAIVELAEAGKTLAAEKGVAWFPDFAALCLAGKPDGIIFATPNQMHVANGLEAVRARVPMLIEKPIADSVAGAAQLVQAAETADVPLCIGHHRRHNLMIAEAKRIVASGKLGRIRAVHGFFWLMKPDDYFEPQWRRSEGAGPIMMNLSHDVDLLRYLVGEITAVQAIDSNAVRGHEIEDTAALVFKFENGALGTFTVSDSIVGPWSWEQTTGENPAYPHTDQTCYFIGGTHGSLSLPRLEVWSNADKRSWWEPFKVERTVLTEEDPLSRQIAQFARVIRDKEPPLVPGREGLKTLQVIEAVKTAARTGKEVIIP